MDWKRGGPSRHSWATFNSLKILYTCNCKSMVHSLRSSSDLLIISDRAVSVLPHPEHSNVHFGQPVSVIQDHTYILQSCWGRSAHHHSQGAPISLYWPPSRTHLPHHHPGCFEDRVLLHLGNRHRRPVLLNLLDPV